MSYIKNLSKSVAYAFPQSVKSKLDNLFSMGGQISSADNREAIMEHFKGTRSILKDNYTDVVGPAFDDTFNALKTGDFSDKGNDNFEFELGTEFEDMDSMFEDDTDNEDQSDNQSSNDASKGDALVASAIIQTNQGIAGKLQDVASTITASSEMNANINRHQLVSSIAGSRAAASYYNAAIQRADRDHEFKESIQKTFYQKNLERLFTINQFIGEVSDKLSTMIEGQKITATATEISSKLYETNVNPSSNFDDMFGSEGGFNVSGYISVLNRRLKNVIDDKSSMVQMFTPNNLLEMAVDTVFPKGFTERLATFDTFIGDLPSVMLTMLGNKGETLSQSDGILNKTAGSLMEFFGAKITPQSQLSLADYSKNSAVAFDGYSHRSIVEVIPTLLGDLLSQVTSIATHLGASSQKGIKAYNYETGNFTNTADERGKIEADIRDQTLKSFELTSMDRGVEQSSQMEELFELMVDKRFNYTGNDADDRLNSLVNSISDPDKFAKVSEGLAQYNQMLESSEDKNQLRYDINSSVLKGSVAKNRAMSELMGADGRENVARFVYNSDHVNPDGSSNSESALAGRGKDIVAGRTTSIKGKSDRTVGDVKRAMESFQENNDSSDDAIAQGGIFSNNDGEVTLKSIYQSPFKMAGRTLDSAREKVNEFIFGRGDGAEDEQRVSIFDKLNDGLFGESGIFSGMTDAFNSNSTVISLKEKFNDMKANLFGDTSNDNSIASKIKKGYGVVGAAISSKLPIDKLSGMASSAVSKFTNMLGIADEDVDAAGGLGAYFKNSIKSKFDSVGAYLFGSEGEGGMFGSLADKSKEAYNYLTEKLFTPISDGFSNVFNSISTSFKENIMTPFSSALFGEDGNGGFYGTLKTQLNENVFAPMKATFSDVYTSTKESLMTGLFNPMKEAFFNIGSGEDGEGIMDKVTAKIQSGVTYLTDMANEKVFAPIGNFFTNPENGLLTKVNTFLFDENTGVMSSFSNYLFAEESGLFTRMNDKLFSGENSYMSRLQGWLNHPETGVLTNLSAKIGSQVDAVTNKLKDIGKDLNENIIQPIKKELMVVWDFATDYFQNEIMSPLKDEIKGMYTGAVNFMKAEVFEPLKGTLQPFVEEAKLQWQTLKTQFIGSLSDAGGAIGNTINAAFFEGFGKSFTDMMRENVLDPIKDTLGSVKKFLISSLSTIIKLPVNLIKNSSDSLREKHAALGITYGDKRTSTTAQVGKDITANAASADKAVTESITKATTGSDKVTSSAKKVTADVKPLPTDKPKSRSEAIIGSVKEQFSKLTGSKNGSITDVVEETAAGNTVLGKIKDQLDSMMTRNSSSESDSLSGDNAALASELRGRSKFSQPTLGAVADALHSSKESSKTLLNFVTNNLRNVGQNVSHIAKALTGGIGKESGALTSGNGILGKMASFIASPIKFLGNITKSIITTATNAATTLVKVPLNILKNSVGAISNVIGSGLKAASNILASVGKLASGIVSAVGSALKAAGNIVGSIGSALAPVLGALANVASNIVTGLAKGASAIVSGITSATASIFKSFMPVIKDVAATALSVTTSIVSAGASLVKSLGSVVSSILKVGSSVVAGVGKAAVGAARGLVGGKQKSAVGALTPVFVVGGRLAGVQGGVETFAEAKAGFNSVKGKFKAVKDRVVESKLFKNSIEYKDKMLKGFSSMKDKLSSGSATLQKVAMFIAGKLFMAFSGLKKTIMDLGIKVLRAMSISRLKKGAGGLLDNMGRKGKGLKGAGKGILKGAGGMLGKVKGLGMLAKGGLVGAAGVGVNMLADEYMEDGLAKDTVRTVGSAASWGATGAMIGSVIPGLGTAVGAGVGAVAGAVYENWEGIKSFIVGIPDMVSGLFSNLKEIPSMIWNGYKKLWSGIFDLAGDAWDGIKSMGSKVLTGLWDGVKALPGLLWDGVTGLGSALRDMQVAIVSTLWDGVKALPGLLWDGLTGLGSALYDMQVAIVSTLWDGIKALPGLLWDGLSFVTESLYDLQQAIVGALWDGVKAIGTYLWDGAKEVGNFLLDVPSMILDSTVKMAENAWSGVSSIAEKAWDGITNKATAVWDGIAGLWPFGGGDDDDSGSSWWSSDDEEKVSPVVAKVVADADAVNIAAKTVIEGTSNLQKIQEQTSTLEKEILITKSEKEIGILEQQKKVVDEELKAEKKAGAAKSGNVLTQLAGVGSAATSVISERTKGIMAGITSAATHVGTTPVDSKNPDIISTDASIRNKLDTVNKSVENVSTQVNTVNNRTVDYTNNASAPDRTHANIDPVQVATAKPKETEKEDKTTLELLGVLSDLKHLLALNVTKPSNKPTSNRKDVSELDLLAVIADKVSSMADNKPTNTNVANAKSSQRVSRDNSADLFNFSPKTLQIARNS